LILGRALTRGKTPTTAGNFKRQMALNVAVKPSGLNQYKIY
jgi:hypothetical protein